jgi:hypothetical protein
LIFQFQGEVEAEAANSADPNSPVFSHVMCLHQAMYYHVVMDITRGFSRSAWQGQGETLAELSPSRRADGRESIFQGVF